MPPQKFQRGMTKHALAVKSTKAAGGEPGVGFNEVVQAKAATAEMVRWQDTRV